MNSTPLQIGITGGIGSGKSTVCEIFNILGAPIYDADSRAKWVMTNNLELKSTLINAFGSKAYLDNGEWNRSYISTIVFNDPTKLKRLNEMVHPKVAEDYSNWVGQHAESNYLIKEAALLYESGSYKQLDKIIVVTAPEPLRIARVLARDQHRTEKEVREIIDKQLAEEEKLKRADYVLHNDETQLLTSQVVALHQQFIGSD